MKNGNCPEDWLMISWQTKGNNFTIVQFLHLIAINDRRLGLQINFVINKLTKADGNCFYRAILQQHCREEVCMNLPDEVKGLVDTMNHLGLRIWIRN